MVFDFSFLGGDRRRAAAMGPVQGDVGGGYVVARWVRSAPSAWVFFDGIETEIRYDAGPARLMPGGAFFLDEARTYPSHEQARAQASRLNALAADADGSWVAIAARRVATSLQGFIPLIDRVRPK
ncbi:hypothetical protein [Aquabacter spiritensis]|uniref:Uncharacterized protein n=1 Tax=Aquabacter spiritensis TaxID=933073 RepID=A0A4R3LXV2_9HYPH|nr:hypothetical protein [Aquabacter spiritensis]TCT05480.1 hypothetical protein EDC64_10436 [Aquabacter spiritensis]